MLAYLKANTYDIEVKDILFVVENVDLTKSLFEVPAISLYTEIQIFTILFFVKFIVFNC